MKKDQSNHHSSLLNTCKVKQKANRYRKSKAILLLEEFALKAAQKRYPNVPYLAPRAYRDDSTNELTKCVVDFLKLEGHLCERTGNEGRVIDNRKKVIDILGHTRMIGNIQRIHSSGMKGTSDLKAILHGKFIAIEIKCGATRDIQSPTQRTYQLEVEKSGGTYLIVPDFESFLKWYQNFMA